VLGQICRHRRQVRQYQIAGSYSSSSSIPKFAIRTIFCGRSRPVATLTGHSKSQDPHVQQRFMSALAPCSIDFLRPASGFTVDLETLYFSSFGMEVVLIPSKTPDVH
jgi:hypothetical protein